MQTAFENTSPALISSGHRSRSTEKTDFMIAAGKYNVAVLRLVAYVTRGVRSGRGT
jgi:hypothetical protein